MAIYFNGTFCFSSQMSSLSILPNECILSYLITSYILTDVGYLPKLQWVQTKSDWPGRRNFQPQVIKIIDSMQYDHIYPTKYRPILRSWRFHNFLPSSFLSAPSFSLSLCPSLSPSLQCAARAVPETGGILAWVSKEWVRLNNPSSTLNALCLKHSLPLCYSVFLLNSYLFCFRRKLCTLSSSNL